MLALDGNGGKKLTMPITKENSISWMFRIKKNGNDRTTGHGRKVMKEKQKLRSYF